MKKLLIIAALLAMTGCTDPNNAQRTLADQGYTKIQTKGYGFFACGREDLFSTTFSANTVAGKQVEGVVCKGIFKGSTIRTF